VYLGVELVASQVAESPTHRVVAQDRKLAMTIRQSVTRSLLIGIAAALAVLGAAFLIWQRVGPRAVTVSVGKFPEELVYVRSLDDIVNGGALFTSKESPNLLRSFGSTVGGRIFTLRRTR
jgi:hypothetical protein